MYSAIDIAYSFVFKGIQEGKPITQMQLQKMVYFAQGLHLALNEGERLVEDEVQAWKFGPVYPKIYNEYKLYGDKPITDFFWLTLSMEEPTEPKELDENAENIVNQTWDILKNIDGIKLSNWTHAEDSPWSEVYKPGINDITIPVENIQRYFLKFTKKEADEKGNGKA